jgi:NADH-quinone oxidoreductase subunit L
MSGEQDLRKMGGLKKALPITFLTMLIATIAISGIPPFSGFFSKDEILAHVYDENKVLWFIASVTSMLTAFYMFRMLFLTFFGNFRGTDHQKQHLHESPVSMTFPLIVLAALSILGGLLGLPEFMGAHNWISDHLSTVIIRKDPIVLSHETEYLLMSIATIAAAVSIYTAYNVYLKGKVLPAAKEEEMGLIEKTLYHKYKVDEFYQNVITKPLELLSQALYKFFDTQVIDGLVHGVGNTVRATSSLVRKLQTGNISFYIIAMVLGVIVFIYSTLL